MSNQARMTDKTDRQTDRYVGGAMPCAEWASSIVYQIYSIQAMGRKNIYQ